MYRGLEGACHRPQESKRIITPLVFSAFVIALSQMNGYFLKKVIT